MINSFHSFVLLKSILQKKKAGNTKIAGKYAYLKYNVSDSKKQTTNKYIILRLFLKNLISIIDESINKLRQTKSVVCDKKTKLLLKLRKRKNNKKFKFESLLQVTSLRSLNNNTIKINKFEKVIIL